MKNLSGLTNGDVDKVYVASVHLCKRAEIPEPPEIELLNQRDHASTIQHVKDSYDLV